MTTAILSKCEQYRYSLRRKIPNHDYTADKGTFAIVMLNPSTADATVDDPTIRRCMGFAKELGYSDIHVVNLFAYRATNPDELKSVVDPIGLENDYHLEEFGRMYQNILCAWGNNAPLDRVKEVLPLLVQKGAKLWCLGVTKTLAQKHPLYVKKSTELRPWVLLENEPTTKP